MSPQPLGPFHLGAFPDDHTIRRVFFSLLREEITREQVLAWAVRWHDDDDIDLDDAVNVALGALCLVDELDSTGSHMFSHKEVLDWFEEYLEARS